MMMNMCTCPVLPVLLLYSKALLSSANWAGIQIQVLRKFHIQTCDVG